MDEKRCFRVNREKQIADCGSFWFTKRSRAMVLFRTGFFVKLGERSGGREVCVPLKIIVVGEVCPRLS